MIATILLLLALPQGSANIDVGQPKRTGYMTLEITAFTQDRKKATEFTVTIEVSSGASKDQKAEAIADAVNAKGNSLVEAGAALGTTVVAGTTSQVGRVRVDVTRDDTQEDDKVTEHRDYRTPDALDTYMEFGLLFTLEGTSQGGTVELEVNDAEASYTYPLGASRATILSDLAWDFWGQGVPAFLGVRGDSLFVLNTGPRDGIHTKRMFVDDAGLVGGYRSLDNQ